MLILYYLNKYIGRVYLRGQNPDQFHSARSEGSSPCLRDPSLALREPDPFFGWLVKILLIVSEDIGKG